MQAYQHQGPDDVSHHVAQKTICGNIESDTPSCLAFPGRLHHMPPGMAAGAARGFERFEIMFPQNKVGSLLHGLDVQGGADPPVVMPADGDRQVLIQNPIPVALAQNIVARMKSRMDRPALPDNDVPGKQAVESFMNLVGRKARLACEICRLPQGMDTGIGASRADELYFLPRHGLKGGFDGLLDRCSVGLALPTVITGSVVFNDELEVCKHLYPVALQRRQCRFHGFIQLVQQVAQIVLMAASLAAPLDPASGTLHDQRLAAAGTNECCKVLFHGHDLLFTNRVPCTRLQLRRLKHCVFINFPVAVSSLTVLLKKRALDN